MALRRADLHTHTTASDGALTPAQLVRQAVAAGLQAVAITDHDTMAGVDEAIEEAARHAIEVVPGVEISAVFEGKDIHVLGYYPNANDPLWQQRLAQIQRGRANRNQLILDKLNELGMPLTLNQLIAAAGKSGDNETIGRPHIAQLLIAHNYVSSMEEAFERFLGQGKAAYVGVPRVTPFEAIDWIHEAGGTSVIAHPGLYANDALVEELLRYGAKGLEVLHSDHSAIDESRYQQLARRYKKIETGGSDFHGERAGIFIHGQLGNRTVDAAIVKLLLPSERKL